MLERLSTAVPLAALIAASACHDEREDVHIRASACIAAFQEGEGDSEGSFTITPDPQNLPQLGKNHAGELAGFNAAFYVDSTVSPENSVDVEGMMDGSLQAVGYEGSLWSVDPTTVYSVGLTTEMPAAEGWEEDELAQGLYASVDMSSAQEGSTWNPEERNVVSVSFFTQDCEQVVEDMNGDASTAFVTGPDGVSYLN